MACTFQEILDLKVLVDQELHVMHEAGETHEKLLLSTIPAEVGHRLKIITQLAHIMHTFGVRLQRAIWQVESALMGPKMWHFNCEAPRKATLSHLHDLHLILADLRIQIWTLLLSSMHELSKKAYSLVNKSEGLKSQHAASAINSLLSELEYMADDFSSAFASEMIEISAIIQQPETQAALPLWSEDHVSHRQMRKNIALLLQLKA